MKIVVKVKPNSKKKKVEKIDKGIFSVFVKELPVQGKANQAVRKLLAEYFNVLPSRVRIVSGRTSKNKIIEIL